jgi:hypothetical protein
MAYNDFSATLGVVQALGHINSAFDGTVGIGHNHNPAETGMGAMIPTTALSGMIQTSVLSGKIAGANISGIVSLATTASVASKIAGVNVSGPVATCSGIIETGSSGLIVYTKKIDIGDWNMDSTEFISVPHGLGSSWNKILSVGVMILNDLGTYMYSLSLFSNNPDPHLINGGIFRIDSSNVVLYKRSGGIFDSDSFDSTSYNRGYIVIQYTS